MRRKRTVDGVTVNGIAGTHVVLLGLDLAAERRNGCLGFAIQREDHTEDERYWLSGMKTFAETDPALGPGGQVSSRQHPFQTFQWADYSAKPEHEYSYTVIPLYGTPAKLSEGPRVVAKVTTEAELGKPHSAFFNRGSVASQEYARRFQDIPPSKLEGEQQIAAYQWLSRGLHEGLLAFIARAKGKDFGLCGAIYEFQWADALTALRAAAASGANVQVLYDDIVSKTGPYQRNEAAIAAAKIKGLTKARTAGKLMHNKFLVLTRKGQPVAVWTGSTNWTENGIFGHFNCGHIVEDQALTAAYHAYWSELCENNESKVERAWMGENNPNPPETWDGDLTAVFSPRVGDKILDWYAEIAGGAKDALFMTFAFGMDERFKDVYRRDDEVLRFSLMEKEGNGRGLAQGKKDIAAIRQRKNVVVAIGNHIVTNSFDRWLREMAQLDPQVNVHWVHTKIMLVDPLSRSPITVTGSANFSQASTDTNNENMLLIRGDTRVADIYLGEFMRLYSHYAFREVVAKAKEWGNTEWRPSDLISGPEWQTDYFKPGEERYWRRQYFAQTG